MTLSQRWLRGAAIACALLAGSSCREEAGPVRLGVALSLTEPGVVPMVLGARLAAREINAAGGIGGRPLELVERDDFADSDSAVGVAAAFYASDVSAVIGGAYSGLTLAAAPVYNGGRDPVVQLSPSASSPLLSGAGDYTFRLCPSDLAYGAALASFALERGLGRVALLYINDEYGRGFRQTFTAEFLRLGGKVEEADPFLADDPDVRHYLARIVRQRRVDAIVLAANQEEGLRVVAQIRAAGLSLPILAGDGMVGAERTEPVTMEGTYIVSGYIIGASHLRNRAFVTAYRRAFPEAGPPDQGAAASYDAVHLLAQVLEREGTERERVRGGLAAVGGDRAPYEGVVGTVAFDARGDVPTLRATVGVARGGLLQPARE
ncbi:MAG: ABC transporter substrate-binding protein [Gemmatimonadetes bacterium]|nr:ABC transporter substrate-binding protein [Gemmatimonadota bacterium]